MQTGSSYTDTGYVLISWLELQ